jgi:DNA-binding response OmpR family regulator
MTIEGLRMLFVDDEEELVSALTERLELRGIITVGATRGAEALEYIDGQDFDIVVLDVKMPGLGGLEVIERIKAAHPGLPVILLSGHGSEDDAERGLELGAFDYLMKPVKIDALLATCRKAVAAARLSQ